MAIRRQTTLKGLSRELLNGHIEEAYLNRLFSNHVLIQLAKASILENQDIQDYINSHHYIVFIEDTKQIYVDGIYYGTSVDRETVEELIQQYFDENVQELVDEAITTLVEKNDDHIEIKLVETETEDPDTHEISYIKPYKYDITLKDIASYVEYQTTANQLKDLVTYTYTTTELIDNVPTVVQHEGTISYISEYLTNTVIGDSNNINPSYNTLEKIAEWITHYEAGDIDLSDIKEKVNIHDAFLDVRYDVEDPVTHEQRPITLSGLASQISYEISGPLRDDEFIVTQIIVDGQPTIPDEKLNPDGDVPYTTLTQLNVALKKVSDRIAEGEEPAEANKINTIIGDEQWINAYTNTSSKETTISFNEETLTYTLNKRLCWNEVIRLPEPDNG